MASATSDRQGAFEIRGLSAGHYRVLVEGQGDSVSRSCRLWNGASAPPYAAATLTVPLDAPVVRGQGPMPFPITSLRQGAVVAGITAGAIAAPAIYRNMVTDNRGPLSP